jgi:hypothetical protein
MNPIAYVFQGGESAPLNSKGFCEESQDSIPRHSHALLKETSCLEASLRALFQTAKKQLQHPAIELQFADGSPIALKLAGPASKYAGSVHVTDGKPFGQNKWFGAVKPDGTWEPSENGKLVKDDLTHILKRLAQNPAKVAADYGKLFCFCHLHESARIGHGLVRAQHRGLAGR